MRYCSWPSAVGLASFLCVFINHYYKYNKKKNYQIRSFLPKLDSLMKASAKERTDMTLLLSRYDKKYSVKFEGICWAVCVFRPYHSVCKKSNLTKIVPYHRCTHIFDSICSFSSSPRTLWCVCAVI